MSKWKILVGRNKGSFQQQSMGAWHALKEMSHTFLSDKLPGLTSSFHIFMLYDMLLSLKLHIADNYDRSCFHLRYAQKSYFLINIASSYHEVLLQWILHSTNLSEQRHWKQIKSHLCNSLCSVCSCNLISAHWFLTAVRGTTSKSLFLGMPTPTRPFC